MTNNNSEVEKNEVIKMGKMPDNITSNGSTKSETISFKVSPQQKEQLKADMKHGGFKNQTEYIVSRLFNGAPVITLPEGRNILSKLAELESLLHDLRVGDAHNSFDKIIEKISGIELSISQIFDYMDVIKGNFIDEKGDE